MMTKPPPGVMDDPLHPLSQGCVCHLLFNEGAGSLAYDVSGHQNHGVLKNMLPNMQGSGWIGNTFGGGLAFDDTDDYVDCGNNSSLNIVNAITIEAWVNLASIQIQTIISKYVSSPYPYRLALIASGEILWEINNVSDTYSVSTIPVNRWTHIGVTYDTNLASDQKKIYLNGVIDETATYDTAIGENTNHVSIGRHGYAGGGGYLDGSLNTVRIFNRALSAKEIRELYYDPFCNLMQVPTWQLYSILQNPYVGMNEGAVSLLL